MVIVVDYYYLLKKVTFLLGVSPPVKRHKTKEILPAMTNQQQDTDKLIIRILNGTALTEDYVRLKKWLEEDEQNRIYFKQARKVWHITSHTPVSPEELTLALKKYRNYIHNHKFISSVRIFMKISGYAAIAILAFGISYLLLQQNDIQPEKTERQNNNVMLSEEIPSGQIKLKRSDGSIINLSDTTSNIRMETDGTILNRNGERALEYKTTVVPIKEEMIYNELFIPAGERFHLTLADGTGVWLNGGSSLSYPVNFSGKRREIRLCGQAYLEVSKDKQHPFIIKTDKMEIEVLGTSFEVAAYLQDEEIYMTLVEGSVKVSAQGQIIIAKPDEQVILNSLTGGIKSKTVDAHALTMWKDGVLILHNQTFRQMLQKLERWYGVEFFNLTKITNTELFNGKFDREDITTAMETISKSAGISYSIKGRAITIFN